MSAAKKLPQEVYGEDDAARKAEVISSMALDTGIACGLVAKSFSSLGHFDAELTIPALSKELDFQCERLELGDLAGIEKMLLGQALALQAVFSKLAQEAASQKVQKRYESLMALALKAQGNSRATLQALIEMKQPRQAVFAKQANISSGPQQVNNSAAPALATAKTPTLQALELSPVGEMVRAAIPARRGESTLRARPHGQKIPANKRTIQGVNHVA